MNDVESERSAVNSFTLYLFFASVVIALLLTCCSNQFSCYVIVPFGKKNAYTRWSNDDYDSLGEERSERRPQSEECIPLDGIHKCALHTSHKMIMRAFIVSTKTNRYRIRAQQRP